jgi:hypothetical protein
LTVEQHYMDGKIGNKQTNHERMAKVGIWSNNYHDFAYWKFTRTWLSKRWTKTISNNRSVDFYFLEHMWIVFQHGQWELVI